ncbi:hypothetical protein V6N11_044077 [Hibiscus sabdariffa]|uniref:Uncharacterized protein n=1 Tax=Hibiscus sabdariffa TaxID=183260 RepID=A0ABR2RE62_9ROSI
MSDGNGSWSWHLFQHLLPSNILLQTLAIKGPFPALPCDFIGRRSSLNRRFTESSVLVRSRSLQDLSRRKLKVTPSVPIGCPDMVQGPCSWHPHEKGWVKLNKDGARRSVDGMASFGGVLHNHTSL